MAAKLDLDERLRYLRYTIGLIVLVDVGIAKTDHNGSANLLRKGLGIISFNILEDFIKNRSAELLENIALTGIAFNKLPEKLQNAATLDALNAIQVRAKQAKRNGSADWQKIVQDEALKVYSTNNTPYQFSKYSLLSSTSNISVADINFAILCFGIKGGWDALKKVSDAIGGGLPNLSQTYQNLADNRHEAAHSASFNYPYASLKDIRADILQIAASIDILLSARVRQIEADTTKQVNDHDILKALSYRFLELKDNKYRETSKLGGKARKIWPDLLIALSTLRPLLKNRNEFLIIIEGGRVTDWMTN